MLCGLVRALMMMMMMMMGGRMVRVVAKRMWSALFFLFRLLFHLFVFRFHC